MNGMQTRRSVIDTALSMNRSGLNQGTAGNISVRFRDGFLITPSALPYEECKPSDLVLMSGDGTWAGTRKPSTEWRLHADVYQHYQDAGAILHAHPPWCTTLACLDRPIPAFHYMVAVAGGDSIPCAPYAVFGSQELSDNVIAALKARSACLMSHHGMICHAGDLAAVLALAIEVEHLARIYIQALQIAEPALLSRSEMEAVLARFVEYRKRTS